MDSIRNYLGEKEFRMSEILQFGIMFLLSGFLIGGGIIILNDEEIFKKIYEGYQDDTTSGSGPIGENNGSSLLQNATETRSAAVTTARAAAVATAQARAVAAQQAAVSNTWTADLPDELLLVNLQKNVKLLRKKSLINTVTAWTMIALGSIICIYQIYNLFFS